MDENVLQDLKQFISTTISQQTAQLATKEDLQTNMQQLEDNLSRIEEKIDDISGSIADALDAGNEATHDQLNDHEMRITKLEQKTA